MGIAEFNPEDFENPEDAFQYILNNPEFEADGRIAFGLANYIILTSEGVEKEEALNRVLNDLPPEFRMEFLETFQVLMEHVSTTNPEYREASEFIEKLVGQYYAKVEESKNDEISSALTRYSLALDEGKSKTEAKRTTLEGITDDAIRKEIELGIKVADMLFSEKFKEVWRKIIDGKDDK